MNVELVGIDPHAFKGQYGLKFTSNNIRAHTGGEYAPAMRTALIIRCPAKPASKKDYFFWAARRREKLRRYTD
jgi:hypothetical protein